MTCAYSGLNNARMTFYLYVPQEYNPSDSSTLQQRYPLTLILHGGGERADPKKTATQNRAAVLNQEYIDVWGPGWPPGGKSVQASWPGFVVVPQVVGSNRWVNVPANVTSYALAAQPTSSLQMAINIVALIQQKYPNVDTNRLYITGISMGGFGVTDSAPRNAAVEASTGGGAT